MKTAPRVFASICLLCLAAGAQPRPIVLRAARMFDGKSDRIVSPGVLVVIGDKIDSVGDANGLERKSSIWAMRRCCPA